jgi:hypothetical protein
MTTSSADFLGNFVRVDGDAAAVVGDGEGAVGGKLYLDEGGVPRQSLVHGVVDHLGEQVMERLLVGAADIHTRPPAHRLEAFQHIDIVSGVGSTIAIAGRFRTLQRRARRGRLGEQVSGSRLLLCRGCGLGHAVPMRLMPAYRSASDGVGLSFSRA